MRGKGNRADRISFAAAAAAWWSRNPRFAGVGGLAGSDLLPEFASLQVCPATACGACSGTGAVIGQVVVATVDPAGEYEGFTQHAEKTRIHRIARYSAH